MKLRDLELGDILSSYDDLHQWTVIHKSKRSMHIYSITEPNDNGISKIDWEYQNRETEAFRKIGNIGDLHLALAKKVKQQ